MLLAIQRGQLFARICATHHDGLILHAGQVERMHRMAGLHHHEIGNIHDVVDRAHARAVEIFAHPLRAGADLHVRDHACAVARAGRVVQHLDLCVILKFALAVLLNADFRHHKMLVQHGGAFTRQSPHAQAIRTIRQNFKIDHLVAQSEHLVRVRAGRDVLEHLKNTFIADMRIQAGGNIQLGAGAQHTAGNLPAHLALLDLHAARQVRTLERRRHAHARVHVRRAAYDLDRLFLTDVHHADVQVVGIGMIHAGKHLAYDHVVKLRAGLFHALDGRAGHNHFGGVFLAAHVDVHIFPKPLHWHLHNSFSSPLSLIRQRYCVRKRKSFSYR